MHGKFDDWELEEMILKDMGISDPSLFHKIIGSWEKVHTQGTKLGKRNGMYGVPYQHWVIERVKIAKLHFSIEVPLRLASLELVPVSFE